MSDPRWEKLPKWARDAYQQAIRERDRAIALAADGPEDSNVILDPYWNDDGRPLGRDVTVHFRMDGFSDRNHSDYIQARIERQGGRSFLYLMGGDALLVEPQSSNTLKIHQARMDRLEPRQPRKKQ